jgi:WhiB family redox-sensing transcriptional regulator
MARSLFASNAYDILAVSKTLPGTSWKTGGLCAEMRTEAATTLNDPTLGTTIGTCGTCPVRSGCLEYALIRDDRFGLWAQPRAEEERPAGRRARLRLVASQS